MLTLRFKNTKLDAQFSDLGPNLYKAPLDLIEVFAHCLRGLIVK